VSALRQALIRLNRAVGTLEISTHHLEKSLNGEQRDMFSAPVLAGNLKAVDTEIVAKKLDKAIARIEKVLKEERA